MQYAGIIKIKLFSKILSFVLLVYIAFLSIAMSLTAVVLMFFSDKSAFHKVARFWAKSILFIARIKLDVTGLEFISKDKSYIFCANHSSLLDIPVLQTAIPQDFRIIYKKELEKIPIFGWGLGKSPYIGIRRQNGRDSMSGIDEAVESIKTGESVVIFPEGTRSPDGNLGEFKRGAFLLASRSAKEIVPVTIIGSAKLLPNKELLLSSGTIKVVISQPIQYTGTSKVEEVKLMKDVFNIINENLKK
jgi:1-acyl-sn-glycerol-3-phosphate acyltransferase